MISETINNMRRNFNDLIMEFSLVKGRDVQLGTARSILSRSGFVPERQEFWKHEITRYNPGLNEQFNTNGAGAIKYSAFYLLYRILCFEQAYGDKFMLVHDGKWSDNFKSASQVNKMMAHPYKNAGGVSQVLKKHGCQPAAVVIDITSATRGSIYLYNTEDAIRALKKEGETVGVLLDNGKRYVPGSGLFTADNFGSGAKAWLSYKKPAVEMNGVKYYPRSVFDAWNTKRKITPLRGMPDLITTMHERDLFLDVISARERELDDALIQYDQYVGKHKDWRKRLEDEYEKRYSDKIGSLQLDLNNAQSAVRKHKQTIEELSTELETIKGLLGLG